MLDSYPGAHTPDDQHEVVRVMRTLSQLPKRFDAREDFVDALVERGLTPGIAGWLSQNLVREGASYRFRLDLGALSDLLQDYYREDLWPVLEEPPNGVELHFVIAERSKRLSELARARLGELSAHAAVQRHLLPNAGHWLHVDNPKGLLELLRQGFAGRETR